MKIRAATRSDLEDLVRLNDQIQWQHANQYPHEFKYPADKEKVAEFFERLIDSDSNTVVVVCDKDQPIAYLYCELQRIPQNTFKFAKSRYYIHHILIDETVRRTGIASALFEWVEEQARGRGVSEIALDTWMLNKEAHEFFERKGFHLTQLLFSKALK